MRVSVIGAGAFGSALAIAMSGQRDITLWARDEQTVATLTHERRIPRLPDVTLTENIAVTGDLDTAFANDIILLAIPAQRIGEFVETHRETLAGKVVVSCAKGIDLETLAGTGSTIARLLPNATPAVLTGPSFAIDIARGLPTALTLACPDPEVGAQVQRSLSANNLRLYRTTDMLGAELGGALKNVMAIACGACMGEGMGESTRAALMTRGMAEITRMAAALGAQPDTLMGLSGFGDLVLTCTSDQSRNYRYGLALGRNDSFDPTLTVEGVATTHAVARLAKEKNIDMPIVATLADLFETKSSVAEAIQVLLSRPLKEE